MNTFILFYAIIATIIIIALVINKQSTFKTNLKVKLKTKEYIKELEEDNEYKDRTIEKLNTYNANIQKERDKYDSENRYNVNKVVSLNNSKKQLQNKVASLEKENSKLINLKNKYEEYINTIHSNITIISKTIDGVETKVSFAERAVMSVKSKIAKSAKVRKTSGNTYVSFALVNQDKTDYGIINNKKITSK